MHKAIFEYIDRRACQARRAAYRGARGAVRRRARQGRPADIIAETAEEVAGNPFRERLVGQLMIGLSQSGKRTEALRVYRGIQLCAS